MSTSLASWITQWKLHKALPLRQKAPIKEARKEGPNPRCITVMLNGKIINERKKAMDDADDERSAASAKSSKSIKSLTKTMKALENDNRRLKKSVSALQKFDEDDNDDSSLSSVEGSTHFQDAVETLQDSYSYPEIALALKSKKSMGLDLRNILLLDSSQPSVCVATGNSHLQ
jgi:hypothetical protein